MMRFSPKERALIFNAHERGVSLKKTAVALDAPPLVVHRAIEIERQLRARQLRAERARQAQLKKGRPAIIAAYNAARENSRCREARERRERAANRVAAEDAFRKVQAARLRQIDWRTPVTAPKLRPISELSEMLHARLNGRVDRALSLEELDARCFVAGMPWVT